MIKAKQIKGKILPELNKVEEKKLDRIIEVAFLEGSLQLLTGIIDESLSDPQEVYKAVRGRLRYLTNL